MVTITYVLPMLLATSNSAPISIRPTIHSVALAADCTEARSPNTPMTVPATISSEMLNAY